MIGFIHYMEEEEINIINVYKKISRKASIQINDFNLSYFNFSYELEYIEIMAIN